MGIIFTLFEYAVMLFVRLIVIPIFFVIGFVFGGLMHLLGIERLMSFLSKRSYGLADRIFSKSANPLLRGDLLTYAEREYPRERFPTAWKDIPDDIRRPLDWDGRLLNGRHIGELAKAALTDTVVRSAAIRSAFQAITFCLAISIIRPLMVFINTGGSIGAAARSYTTPFPSWAYDAGAVMPIVSWTVLTVIEHAWALLSLVAVSGMTLLLFPVFWLFCFAGAMTGFWQRVSDTLRLPTRDNALFWKSNALTRKMQYEAYCREVEQATTRLKDQPLITVGRATGTIRARGDMEAPTFDQTVAYDGESIRQHTLILGGTGSGKTRLVIRPLFKRIMSANWGEGHKIGAYVTDGKGTLWRDLAPLVDRDDVAIIGTDEGQYGLDLCQGMSPLEISTTFKAIAAQLQGESKDSFWPESASLLLMHSATIARAMHVSDEAVAVWNRRRHHNPYSLMGVALMAGDEESLREAFTALGDIAADMADQFTPEQREMFIAAKQSKDWLCESFLKLGDNTKGSIIANVTAVLGKLSGAPEISRRFCQGNYAHSVDVDHALKGGVLFIAVGENEHGMAGKVVTSWLKTRLYILARRRLLTDPEACRTTSCAMFVDEAQSLLTTGPDSDSSFWNIARETGVFATMASQSLAALNQAIGEHATANLTNLLRSKIILKTEEQTTLDYAVKLSGQIARGWEYEAPLYATHAAREQALGSWRDIGVDQVQTSMIHSLMPSVFSTPTAPYEAYSAQHLAAMWQRASNPSPANGNFDTGDGGASQNAQSMAIRQEDKNRQAMVDGVQFRPKIDQDELLIGSGFAFAIVQRAGGDRMDIIDLEIAA